MCGIVGALALGSNAAPIAAGYIDTMRDSIAHRGPDGAGTWVSPDGRVGFGHRRLAIVDLSDAASQPMAVEDGTVLVTYNGEIYNHAEIRRELEATGRHRFRTDHSDTEVLLRAYLEWGVECLSRFRGMFAFALWDARSRKLWLVRDRIGIKPLYYSIHHDRLVFGSEIKALLADPEQPRAVDEDSLFHYLSFLTTPGPETLFAGIRKLAAGTWLLADGDGRIEERRYWDALDVPLRTDGASDDAIAAGLLDELRTAVRLHKVGDVPVGVFLSGGIDSSTNATLFAEDATSTVKTFSIGYDSDYGTYRNELGYARDVADRLGAEHHELRLTQKDLVDFLPRMVALQDEPIADPVCVPVYYVSKLARDAGVIVAQVGEGADELFWGYPNWRRALRLQRLADGAPFAAARGSVPCRRGRDDLVEAHVGHEVAVVLEVVRVVERDDHAARGLAADEELGRLHRLGIGHPGNHFVAHGERVGERFGQLGLGRHRLFSAERRGLAASGVAADPVGAVSDVAE
jgi:asparagine synthase (glutamine-hydrolysing)